MLTNLDWLSYGAEYPPKPERDRLERYRLNEQLFLSNHPQAWKDDFNELARRLHKKASEVETIFNYQQLLSKKTADFVCGQPPTIETEQNTDNIVCLLNRQKWNVLLYEAFIDVSRYGNAVIKLKGKSMAAVSPSFWFPVVSPTDLKEITHHVIAYPTEPDKDGRMTKLYAEIHEPGKITIRLYSLSAENKIGALLEEKTESLSFEDFAVHILANVTHSGSIFGIDDYAIVNSLTRKLMWRLHCIDNILDKHSEPSMSGPQSALSYDEKFKRYFLDLGKYFTRNSNDDPDLKYITWDGNLTGAFEEAELLFKQIYVLSEMGQAFTEGDDSGAASSGTALKLRLVSPRVKAARLVGINESTVKTLICLLAQINGIVLDYEKLTLHWSDGLPVDETEQLQNLYTATGGKAIMSQYAAMKRMGLSDSEVEAELQQIADENAASAPIQLTAIDSNGDSDDE